MAVTTKNGWIYAVRELENVITDSQTSTKPEIVALTPLENPSTATAEQVATLLNELIAALKA
jgi:hypothetical protein